MAGSGTKLALCKSSQAKTAGCAPRRLTKLAFGAILRPGLLQNEGLVPLGLLRAYTTPISCRVTLGAGGGGTLAHSRCRVETIFSNQDAKYPGWQEPREIRTPSGVGRPIHRPNVLIDSISCHRHPDSSDFLPACAPGVLISVVSCQPAGSLAVPLSVRPP